MADTFPVEKAKKHLARIESDFLNRDEALAKKQSGAQFPGVIAQLQAEREKLKIIYSPIIESAKLAVSTSEEIVKHAEEAELKNRELNVSALYAKTKTTLLSQGYTEEQFEKMWPAILEKHGIENGLYAIRGKDGSERSQSEEAELMRERVRVGSKSVRRLRL